MWAEASRGITLAPAKTDLVPVIRVRNAVWMYIFHLPFDSKWAKVILSIRDPRAQGRHRVDNR